MNVVNLVINMNKSNGFFSISFLPIDDKLYVVWRVNIFRVHGDRIMEENLTLTISLYTSG